METNLEKYVADLELPFEGEMAGPEYIITLDNSDDFSSLYNLISTSGKYALEENSISTTSNAVFIFFDDYFELRFTSDFDKDIYRLTISRR